MLRMNDEPEKMFSARLRDSHHAVRSAAGLDRVTDHLSAVSETAEDYHTMGSKYRRVQPRARKKRMESMAGVHIASTFPEIDTENGWPCAMMQEQLT